MNIFRELRRRHQINRSITVVSNPGEPMDKWYALAGWVFLILVGCAILILTR